MKYNFFALAFFVPCLTYGAAGKDLYSDSPTARVPGGDSLVLYIDANSKMWFLIKKGILRRIEDQSEIESEEPIAHVETPLTDFDFIRVIMGYPRWTLIKPEGNEALRGFHVQDNNQIIAPDGAVLLQSGPISSPG